MEECSVDFEQWKKKFLLEIFVIQEPTYGQID